MCGRLNVNADPLNTIVSAALGIRFETTTNTDLRPSQRVSTVCGHGENLTQEEATWGIKPAWAKRLIINAQAETVASKPTFKRAFANARCVVPCTGWYEWCASPNDLNGAQQKQKTGFSQADGQCLYMAGILLNTIAHDSAQDTSDKASNQLPELVTLTCAPDRYYRAFHHRLPLIIPEHAIASWLTGDPALASQLLLPPELKLVSTAL